MQVLDTPIASFTHVLHFADIHIRSGDIERSRYEEYHRVFANTIAMMDGLPCVQQGTALIVIAGDLFHHKGKMDTPALKLYFSWMDQLLARAPVVMICGNHDFRQEDPRHPDMMETMSLPYEAHRQTKYPLMYLKQTGHYQIGDVGFGVVSVRDTLRSFNTSGQVDKLPAYPSPAPFSPSCTTRIALFHGTICQSALPNDHRASTMSGYPLQWFQGYDMVLLGDNHKNQYHVLPQPWGYPGSLVQQDFGESTYGHGFLLWDLKKRTAKHHHVPNPQGMITMKWFDKYNNYAVLFGRRDVCVIDEAIERGDFPKQPRVRILGATGEDTRVQAVLQQYDVHPTSMITSSSIDHVAIDDDSGRPEDVRDKIVHLADLNEPSQWIEYLRGVAPELNDVVNWFTHPESLCVVLDDHTRGFLPKDVVQKITDRNARIQKAIDEYRDKVQEKHVKYRIALQHMSWDYAMCYGQGNHFDFSSIQNSIALLNGRNASGKSSFLDVLCIGLFGEPTKHRNMLSGKKMTSKMIHDHRPPNKSVMKVAILFQLDDQQYEIVRSFTTQKKDDQSVYAQLHSARVYIVSGEEDSQEKEVIAEGSIMVEQWISTYFGTIEDMLMSTILCQLDISNFFYLKQDEQKAILDHAMQLGSITSFAKIIKESTLAYNEWITLLRTSLQAIGGDGAHMDIATPQEIAQMADTVSALQAQLLEKQGQYKALLGDIGVMSNIPELSDKEIASHEKKLTAKLSQYADVENENMEEVYTYKGEAFTRYNQCQEAMEQLKTQITDVFGSSIVPEQECQRALKDVHARIEKHNRAEKQPSVSKEHLTKLEKDLCKWKAKYPSEWVEDPDQVHIQVQEIREEAEKKRARLEQVRRNAVAKPNVAKKDIPIQEGLTLAIAQQRHGEAVEALNHVYKERQALTLSRDMSKYEKWRSEWRKWKQEVAQVADGESADALGDKCAQYEAFITSYKCKQDEWDKVMRDLEDIQKELDQLQDIPFNPECWACKLQPAMKRKMQLASAFEKMKRASSKASKYMKQYEQHGDIASLEQELQATRKLHTARMYFEQTKEHMENENMIWSETKERAAKVTELQERVVELESSVSELADVVAALQWKQWKQWNAKMDALDASLRDLESQLEEMETFLKEYDVRENDMVLFQVESDKYEQHEVWREQHDVLQKEFETYEKMEQYWELTTEFTQLQDTVGEHAKRIKRMQEKQQLDDQLLNLNKSRLCNQLRVVEADIEQIQTQYESCRVKLALSQTALKRNEDKREQLAWYAERIDEWTTCKQKLVLLESKFIGDKVSSDGYKEWIYREKVVPLLETEVNRFLSTIEAIRLKIQYDKKCFNYFLEDRGNMPTLDKASGYQNFVVGLAMRLALSRIGAVGQNVRHLFIDEGFTACDVANIEKVPQLLRGVMSYGKYDSIVIMSHLEQVQDACDCRIDIERKGMFSFVHHGSQYPNIAMKKVEAAQNETTVKKRGRPKKADV